MVNHVCPRCGLSLHGPATGSEHVERFPGQGTWAAAVSFGCIFHEGSDGLALCMPASALSGASLDVPDGSVLVGPDAAAVQQSETSAWIPFRLPGRMQLLEHRLSPILPAAELLWSWFKHLLLALEALHTMGYAHGHIEKNMLWVDLPAPEQGMRVNQVRLLTPFLTPLSADALGQAQDEDIRRLALLFLEPLQSIETWQKGLPEFCELCEELARDPGQRSQLLPRVASAHRMAQLAMQTKTTEKKVQWKKPVLVFAGLFLASLLVAWIFAGSSKKRAVLPPAPPRKQPSPPAEAVVETSKLRWEADFPIHRVPLDDDVLLYLDFRGGMLPEVQKFLSFASITLPRPPVSDAENFYSFRLEGASWKPRASLIMVRPVASGSGKMPAAAVWTPHVGKGFPLKPDAVSPPPVLLTEPGELLTETGYDPENVAGERMVLILRPPVRTALPRTLWIDWFGGILPSYCVVRLGSRNELRAAFSFERAADAREAARFLESVWKVAGRSSRDLVEVRDRRLRVVVPFGLLSDPPSAPVQDAPPVAPPPVLPETSATLPGLPGEAPETQDASALSRIPHEFLPIPEL